MNIQIINLFIISLCLYSCESIDDDKVNIKKPVLVENNNIRNVLDEVDAHNVKDAKYYLNGKKEIPIDFMISHTVIDSVYYYDGVTFKSDTIFKLNNNYHIGIINYSDGLVCSNKFILVFESASYFNTSYILGETNCDRDGDSEYYYYSFEIKKSKIILYNNIVKKGEEIEDSKVVETSEYLIDDSGRFVLSHTK